MSGQYRFIPAVTRKVLLFIAGVMWLCVGAMLLNYSYSWLILESGRIVFIFSGSGIVLALLVHHFGFLRVADKNLKRILLANGRNPKHLSLTAKSMMPKWYMRMGTKNSTPALNILSARSSSEGMGLSGSYLISYSFIMPEIFAEVTLILWGTTSTSGFIAKSLSLADSTFNLPTFFVE